MSDHAPYVCIMVHVNAALRCRLCATMQTLGHWTLSMFQHDSHVLMLTCHGMKDPCWLAKMSGSIRDFNTLGKQGHLITAHIHQAMTRCHAEQNITMMLVAKALFILVGTHLALDLCWRSQT